MRRRRRAGHDHFKGFCLPISRAYLFTDLVVLGLSLSYIAPLRIFYSLITVTHLVLSDRTHSKHDPARPAVSTSGGLINGQNDHPAAGRPHRPALCCCMRWCSIFRLSGCCLLFIWKLFFPVFCRRMHRVCPQCPHAGHRDAAVRQSPAQDHGAFSAASAWCWRWRLFLAFLFSLSSG